jgi:hypothetical protein
MPMLGFSYETPVCLYDEFREGSAAPAYGQKAFYLECRGRMPFGKRIGYYRSDSASYQVEPFNQLQEDGGKYAITADQDKAVKRVIRIMGQDALATDKDRGETDSIYDKDLRSSILSSVDLWM